MEPISRVAFRFAWLIACTAVLLLAACFPIPFTGASSTATPQPPAQCSRSHPENCLYISDLSYTVGVIDQVMLVDPARNNYEVWLVIRYPVGATGPRPVVIWHHGGHPSIRGAARSEEWGNLLASAGYVVIHPSRTPIPDPAPYMQECVDNGLTTPVECTYWITQARFGPQNTHFLIDNLAAVENLDAALAGMLDATKIVVAGHSAGSASVLANAGAYQQWDANGPRYNERNDTPIAFLATGVQGPMYAGFVTGFQAKGAYPGITEHSFAALDRPFMFITGVGDETGEPPEARTAAWLVSQAGNKALVWDTDPNAVHETMDIDRCGPPVPAGHCEWIGSAGLAFLDAVVRQRPEAIAWMRSNALEILSDGAIELHRR